MNERDPSALDRVFQILGSQVALANRLNVSAEAVRKWRRRIPAERVLQIEEAVDGQVTRHELRPDLYPVEQAAQ